MKLRVTALFVGLIAASWNATAVAQGQSPPPAPQTPATPRVYTPNLPAVTQPMRMQVVDAITMRDVETGALYRLYGVDACEISQNATLGRQNWPCGVVAMSWLVGATLNKWLTCTTIREDGPLRYGRCASGEYPDLAAEMLRAGLAILSPTDQLVTSYKPLEIEARKAYRGLWGSQFQMPWDFRATATEPK